VRTDVDLRKVGTVGDLPPNSSPIQIGTEGVYSRQAFIAIGRILYEYDQGTWNEWHLVMNNGSAWLSDAQDEYVVTFAALGRKLPASNQSQVGQLYVWDNETYVVSTITRAHYRGVEGELPFQYWDKEDVLFVDLMSASGKFASLDYSDESPALYLGEAVEFDSLKLKNLRSFERWT